MKSKQFYFFKEMLDEIPDYADKYLIFAVGAWSMHETTRKQLFEYLKENDETLAAGRESL